VPCIQVVWGKILWNQEFGSIYTPYHTSNLSPWSSLAAVCFKVLFLPLWVGRRPHIFYGPSSHAWWALSIKFYIHIEPCPDSHVTFPSSFVSLSFIFGVMIVFNVSNGASPGDSLARSNGSCRCVHFHSIFNILNSLQYTYVATLTFLMVFNVSFTLIKFKEGPLHLILITTSTQVLFPSLCYYTRREQ